MVFLKGSPFIPWIFNLKAINGYLKLPPWFNPATNINHQPWNSTGHPWLRLSMSKGKGTVDWSKLNCVGKMAYTEAAGPKNRSNKILMSQIALKKKTTSPKKKHEKIRSNQLVASRWRMGSCLFFLALHQSTASSKQLSCELASILRVPASVMGVNLRASPCHHMSPRILLEPTSQRLKWVSYMAQTQQKQ